MKLYIANCTQQMQTINFRMPEAVTAEGRPQRGHSTQQIGMNRQETIAGDLNMPQIDYIVDHLRIYGLHHMDDLDRAYARKVYVPLLFSVDRPVPHDVWHEALAKNKQLLKDMGNRMRREAAIATSHGMRQFSPNAADNVMLSVEEDKVGTMDHSGDRPLAEGWRMVTEV